MFNTKEITQNYNDSHDSQLLHEGLLSDYSLH